MRALSLNARAQHAAETLAKGGAEASGNSVTVLTPVVAISLGFNDTDAFIGTGTALTTAGNITLTTQHDSDYETKGGGDAAGGNAAIGASFALAITEHSAAVRILRGLTSTGGAIAADAQGQFRSRSNAAAGSKGAADSGDADGVKQRARRRPAGAMPRRAAAAPAPPAPRRCRMPRPAMARWRARRRSPSTSRPWTRPSPPGSLRLDSFSNTRAEAELSTLDIDSAVGIGVLALDAAGADVSLEAGATINVTETSGLLAAARRVWALSGLVGAEQLAATRDVTVEVLDLPGLTLGNAAGGRSTWMRLAMAGSWMRRRCATRRSAAPTVRSWRAMARRPMAGWTCSPSWSTNSATSWASWTTRRVSGQWPPPSMPGGGSARTMRN